MKKYLLLLTILFVCLTSFEKKAPLPGISINSKTLVFGSTGGIQEIKVTSNYYWRLDYDNHNDWCNPSVSGGSYKEGIITFTVKPNFGDERSAVFTFVCTEDENIKTLIPQHYNLTLFISS